jgi:hypothetical protein
MWWARWAGRLCAYLKQEAGRFAAGNDPSPSRGRKGPEIRFPRRRKAIRKDLLRISLAVCSVMILSTAIAGDNWLGTWKLDGAKSKYRPGPGPGPKSLT